jgi:arsenate reductase-like glutaredoxin family protein
MKFSTLRRMIFREGLDKVTPSNVLGDVMTDAQYNDSGDEGEEKKKEDKKEKSITFKDSSSSKGKSKKEASSDDSDIDDEAMALLVRKLGKFMKKKGYGARKRTDHMRDNVRLCFECKSPDHVVADCPHKKDHDDKKRKDKKDKKEKKMTFKKNKKGNGYVVTWDSDCSSDSDDESSDDEKKAMKKAFASIAISTKPSLFGASSTCLMAKPTKVHYDSDDDASCSSDDDRSDDEEDPSKEELMDICEQLGKGFKRKSKECIGLEKELKALRKSYD